MLCPNVRRNQAVRPNGSGKPRVMFRGQSSALRRSTLTYNHFEFCAPAPSAISNTPNKRGNKRTKNQKLTPEFCWMEYMPQALNTVRKTPTHNGIMAKRRARALTCSNSGASILSPPELAPASMTSISASAGFAASASRARIRLAACSAEILPSCTICKIFLRSSADITFLLPARLAIVLPARL